MTPPAPRSTRAPARSAALAIAVAACASASSQPLPAGGSGTEATGAAGAAAAPQQGTVELLGAMATLTGVIAEPARLADWAARIDGGAPLGGYLDELLASERFGAEVVPSLVFGAYVNVRNYYALPSAFVLRRGDGDGPFYLRAPCTAAEAVTVRPWWSLDTEVQVCPDAYRPEKWSLAPNEHSYKTPVPLSCDSQVGSPELETRSLCGCGPNLIRCLRDDDQYNEINRSFMNEVKRTTAYVVSHDLPMASLFTENATFRDRNAELYYRRQKIGTLASKQVERELAGLDAWPAEGRWAPRAELAPGQHAGLLTAPQILHWLPDQRQRQRAYYEVMWCNLRNSFGATTHKVLEINANGNNFFVHDSWQKLAHTDLCTNCHARLDYGSRFFQGYPDSRASTHYNPALQLAGAGPLYGSDINDHRGDAPLTPASFAKLATDQPDFGSCMTNHFVSYVLGDRATAEDLRAIEAAVAQAKTFKASMKMALERYAVRWRAEHGAPAKAPPAPAPTPAPAGSAAVTGSAGSGSSAPAGVAIGPALRAKLDQRCVDCHDKAPYNDSTDSADVPADMRGAALPRALVVSMADQVAFGMMPKGQALDPAVREEIVGLLVDTLWTDPAARDEARRYYLGRAHGLPAHQIDNALFTVDALAAAPSEISWGALERGIWSDQSTITPGFLAITGLEAVRACARAAPSQPAALEGCLSRAVSLNALSRWPVPTPAPPAPPAAPAPATPPASPPSRSP